MKTTDSSHNSIKNVFFIQRAAIDVLLLNNATAIEICTYLVICKNTDRHGYESLVGYKTIKERLGIGQRKAGEAIRRLLSMEIKGQKLLYTKGDWIFKKTGAFPRDHDNTGWVRGWLESEYIHQVWLNNDLVGNNGDKLRPLNFFARGSDRDNHARLLLLLYKYHNRRHSGVNYSFISTVYMTEKNSCCKINGIEFNKSRLDKEQYHISQRILDKLKVKIKLKECYSILDDLRLNGFINVSVSVIGSQDEPSHKKTRKKRKVFSDSQIEAWKKIKELRYKLKDHRQTFRLAKINSTKETKSFSIGLHKFYTKAPSINFSDLAFDKLSTFPGDISESDCRFIYRLDYKSNNKRALNLDNCLAGKIEAIIHKCDLKPVSRKGKFYDSYWWINPGAKFAGLVGILMPPHIPTPRLPSNKDVVTTLKTLSACSNYSIENVSIDTIPFPFDDESPF